VSAVVFACVSGTASADQFSSKYGQSTCNETTDNKNGQSLEFYGEVAPKTDDATIGFKYVIEFQKKNMRINRCESMHSLTLQRMRLDLERQKLELEALRKSQAADKLVTTGRTTTDW
jgi:hypothetical protein